MRYAELVAVYDRLAGTTKRLEMRAHLAALLRGLAPDETPEVVYLSQGLLRPEFEGIELGIADSLARRAVALVTDRPEKEIAAAVQKSGDLGTTAEELLREREGSRSGALLEVRDVYAGCLDIAKAAGEGSQELKVHTLGDLLKRATPAEGKYLVRFVLGKLRLGVREMTILDALSEAFGGGTKEARARIEAAFNVSSDLGLVAQKLAEKGLEGLNDVKLHAGRPVRPMLAERSKDLAEVLKRMAGRAALEYKYDGLRLQAHIPAQGSVKLFSRRLEEISAQFPELLEELPKALGQRDTIVEGECVSVDPQTDEIRPFQEISRRRGRKYDLERMQTEVPVCLFLFDVLLEGGEPMLDRPFPERRAALERLVKPSDRVRISQQRVVETVEEATKFFDESIAAGCEGVMAKSVAPGSGYRAGARGFWWIKYKREYTQGLADSVDGVVVGAFHGRGRRGGLYGALLMAVYNDAEDRFESFCKVGSGFDDAALAELPKRLEPFLVETRPESVVTLLEPDRWFRPGVVLEVRGAELTLSPIHRAGIGRLREGEGLALRFPRFTGRYRTDKGPTEATTVDELLELYRAQVKRPSGETPEAEASDESAS